LQGIIKIKIQRLWRLLSWDGLDNLLCWLQIRPLRPKTLCFLFYLIVSMNMMFPTSLLCPLTWFFILLLWLIVLLLRRELSLLTIPKKIKHLKLNLFKWKIFISSYTTEH
jgi:hypothetical protein